MQHQDRIQYLSHLLKHMTDEHTPDQLIRQLYIDLDPYDRTQLIKTLGLAAHAIQCRTEAEAQYTRKVASFRNSPPSEEYCMSLLRNLPQSLNKILKAALEMRPAPVRKNDQL